MKKGPVIGIMILLIAIAATVFFSSGSKKTIVIKGFIGGEKKGFLADKEVLDILEDKYGIKLETQKAGSIEMVKDPEIQRQIKAKLWNFLWPSSQIALELYKNESRKKGLAFKKAEVIFNSPIVLYSWDIVADTLEKQKIVEKRNNTYYIVDLPKLIQLIVTNKQWKDIGLNKLYGKIFLISTDPTKSNSGNLFSGLLANILNKSVVTENSIQNVLAQIKSFYAALGYLEHSSGDLFKQYLRTGVGAKPMIVGYENQIIEFALENQDIWDSVKDKMRLLYPVPTVWSAHPLISLDEKGSKLILALQDPKIKELAWKKHGFRIGFINIKESSELVKKLGIPQRIEQVMPLPTPKVMDIIINALKK